MTRRALGIVALQVAVVGVLVAVVYLTLLAPEDNEPLFDVSVPPGPTRLAPQGPRGDDRQRGDEERHEGRPRKPDRPRPSRQPPPPPAPASTGPDATEPAIPAAPPPPVETPTGDQYADAVARILGEL
jgi:hypothetical protein